MLSGTRNLEAELYDVESGDDDDFFTSDVEFAGFDAAHIFPVANEDDWVNEGYERFVQDDADREDVSLTKINSPQNGMLMRGDVHALWVAWGMAVNVDVCMFLPCDALRYLRCVSLRLGYRTGIRSSHSAQPLPSSTAAPWFPNVSPGSVTSPL